MPPVTAEQIADLQAAAATYPALNDALHSLHVCLKAQWQGDCMGAADDAAKACYDFADEATLFQEAAE